MRVKKQITKQKVKQVFKVRLKQANRLFKRWQKTAVKISRYLAKLGKRFSKWSHKQLIVLSVITAKNSKRFAKFSHHHAAKRPHAAFTKKWAWYASWHEHPHHQKVHYSAAIGCFLVALFLCLMQYGNVKALSDLSNLWDFSNHSEYTASGGINLNDVDASLKEQEYTSDANTAALYHFNETSGSTAADSSSNANTANLNDASFAAGRMNNSLSLNGSTTRTVVPNSASLNLTKDNTLEAWTKLNAPFSKGSSAQRQGIVDKGDYQLYYDNETGKVTYELADNSANSWSLSAGNSNNGSWDGNGNRSVNVTAKIGSNIYAGVGIDTGDAEVWKWDGTDWTMIGGGATSVNNSWGAGVFENVSALSTDGTNLYAGLGYSAAGDGEVWKWNGTSWSKIGGDGVNGGWTNYVESVVALDYFGGNLYAAVGSGANDAEVWSWDGTTWTKIGGDSLHSGWTTNYEFVGMLTNDGTNLYAGLGASAGDSEVWRWNGTSWSKIGGDSVNSSWGATIETVRSLRYYGGNLYAGLGDSAGDGEVWRWNGSTWAQIGGDGINSSWNTVYEQVSSFAWDGTNLYAGLGISDGDGEVWKWNGTSWSKIGGDGANSGWTTAQGDTVNSLMFDGGQLYAGIYDAAGTGTMWSYNGSTWTQMGGGHVNNSWGVYGMGLVQVMQNVGDYLYAGTGGTAGTAEVWQFNGSTWSIIGGQGVNSSWGENTYEQVISMANFKGDLYVGLGTSANDAEVWKWDGSTWSKVGGDSVNSSWGANYEEVDSLAADDTYMYAGLGNGGADAEVWRYDGASWSKIGGDSVNSGWTTYAENVYSLAFYNGKLYAGIGRSTGDAEIWEWSGSAWTKVGGDGIGGSWGAATYEEVDSLMPYNGKLYAGLGANTGSGTLWEWDGTTWTKIGGDDTNGSWTSGTYERVKTIAVYNGDLFAGLGNSTGDGEVWRLSDGTWTKIGGASMNSGWTNAIEEVDSMSAYKGKFYVGTGYSTNLDAQIWSWGNNAFLQSSTSSFDTNWHHIAGTYDGTTMKIFIDGVENSSKTTNTLLPTTSRDVLIGSTYGGREYGKPVGNFDGKIDELRISNIARTSLTGKPYPTTAQTVQPANSVRKTGVWHWDAFDATESGGGSVKYRLSDDEGVSWKYWDGSAWVASGSVSQANTKADISSHVATFPVTVKGFLWQAIMQGDGSQKVTVDDVDLDSTSDISKPSSSAVTLSALKAHGGSTLTANSWTNGSSPEFSWTAGSDGESGVKGYCLYLGTSSSADPVTTKGMLGTSGQDAGSSCQFMVTSTTADLATAGYIATPLTTSNSNYYLIVKTIDNAGNVSNDSASFTFKFDNTPPANPGYISAPSGFVNNKAVTLTWPTSGGSAPNDPNSGLAGLQYRIGASGTWYGASHSGSGDQTDLLTNSGSYTMQDPPDFDDLTDGINTVYFRTFDQAGNITSTYATAAIKLNTSGAPSEPQNIVPTPATNSVNLFNFTWDPPASYVGDVNSLTYCYTINVAPDVSNCNYTGSGITSLASGPYATKPGQNTIYVVAKDESNNINYASYGTADFTANTSAPGMPRNIDIADVSIKTTNKWRLALTWDEPDSLGSGVSKYEVYRSTNNSTFNSVGSSSSTTYIDANLSQQTYYYKVKACDNTNNCGALSSSVHALPTGRFTEPAALVAPPTVSDITTKHAVVRWSTDRSSDSKIALGTTSGSYGSSEVAISNQVSAHEVELNNLSAGTTYYLVAKWTDEDGNTGSSQEFTFQTAPAPSLKEISTTKVGLSNATVHFTSKNASRIAILYGKSESFGGIKSINTSANESTYDVDLGGLEDGSKYFYKLVAYDNENNSYDGSIASFSTPARPKIENLRFQPIKGEPTSTQEVTWTTNVPATSTVTYGKVNSGGIDMQDSQLTKEHRMVIRDLEDDSEYFLTAQSRDGDGNLAVSDRQQFKTALDTRPPKVSNVQTETSIRGTGAEARGQVVVSWTTDEPATSQVAYAEGSNTTAFNNKTSEDSALGTEHIVIVSDLPTSKVYNMQPVSRDKSGNEGEGEPQSTIIGRASDSVLTIILNALQKVFGF